MKTTLLSIILTLSILVSNPTQSKEQHAISQNKERSATKTVVDTAKQTSAQSATITSGTIKLEWRVTEKSVPLQLAASEHFQVVRQDFNSIELQMRSGRMKCTGAIGPSALSTLRSHPTSVNKVGKLVAVNSAGIVVGTFTEKDLVLLRDYLFESGEEPMDVEKFDLNADKQVDLGDYSLLSNAMRGSRRVLQKTSK